VKQPRHAEHPRPWLTHHLPEQRDERRTDHDRGDGVSEQRHPRLRVDHQQRDFDAVRPVARQGERDDREARLAPSQRQRDCGVTGVHSAASDQRRRIRGSERTRSSSAATTAARRRMRRSARKTISTGAASAAASFSGCSPQRYWAARKPARRSRSDTQAFGAERLLRRCAQLSQSVALAASCAPHRPHSEYTRTPCAVTSRKIGRSIVTRNGSEPPVGTVGERRNRRHPAHERTRLINSRRDCMARSLQRFLMFAPAPQRTLIPA